MKRNHLKNASSCYPWRGPAIREGPDYQLEGPDYLREGPDYLERGPTILERGPTVWNLVWVRVRGPTIIQRGPTISWRGPTIREGPDYARGARLSTG